MGTVLMKKVVEDAATLLQDKTGVRWVTAELLSFGNNGQREIVIHKPEACVKNEAVKLSPGTTKQALPPGGVSLVRLVRNMGTTGVTPGDAIRIIDGEILDAQMPDWHSAANAYNLIKHYAFDPRDPRSYYVYPKAPATDHYVDIVYNAAPADCTIDGVEGATTSSPISIDDIYANVLTDYILYRAYSKDADYAKNVQMAGAYFSSFASSLGIKTSNEASRNPNLISGAQGNPNVPRTPSGG